MQYFLERIVRKILNESDDVSRETFIIPNKRAAVYIRKYIANNVNQPVFSPTILTIDEWVKSNTEKNVIGGTELVFLFYKVYKEQEKQNAESFEKFLNWARILLKDFDEIDRYLIESHEIFRDLRNIKELEEWDLDREYFKNIGKYEEKFLGFWDKIDSFYKSFQAYLGTHNLIYSGKAYKDFAYSLDTDNFHFYHFIGFNALSNSEQLMIQKLVRAGKAQIYFDMDQSFFMNQAHEAGQFFRKLNLKWPEFKIHEQAQNFIKNKGRRIEVVATADQVAQVNLASEQLRKLHQKNELNETAVVLADENLIDPFLRSIPKSIEYVNITMGLPIRRTSLKNLTDLVFSFQEHALKFGDKTIYHKDLSQLFKMPIFKKALSKEDVQLTNKIRNDIFKNNKRFISIDSIKESLPKILSNNLALFQKWDYSNLQFLDAYIGIVTSLHENDSLSDLEKETTLLLLDILKKLKLFLKEHSDIEISYSVFKRMFLDELNLNTIDFLGNPIEGLQVMGILETRLLDFKNIIFIGLNEGVLPAGNYSDSIIPVDLKRHHQLPSKADKDAIFAHHFYRLTLRTEFIFATYYTVADMQSSGEKSRYLKQIELEYPELNPKNEFQIYTYKPKDSGVVYGENYIAKGPNYESRLDQLFERGLSPTAMNAYLSCEMDFYYRYIFSFKEEDKVEEDIESSTFGSIVHEVLEELYRPIIGKVVEISYLQNAKKSIETETRKAFNKEFGENGYKHGTNHLAYKVVMDYVSRFIQFEIRFLKDNPGKVIRILELEKSLEKEFKWMINGKEKRIRFQGKADRIDELDGVVRIIDYKTGLCTNDKVQVRDDDTDAMFRNDGKKFMVQLMLYEMMYESDKKTEAGIISFRNLKDGFMNIRLKKKDKDQFMNDFLSSLENKVVELYDLNRTMSHNTSARYCNYCEM